MKIKLITTSLVFMIVSQAQVFGYNFPSTHDQIPSDYKGRVFSLSQNYPQSLIVEKELPWKKYGFKTQPEKYLKAVLGYCFAGNIETDWDVEKNSVRRWYGTPWMHTGPSGREFIRGMTSERTSRKGELSYKQSDEFQNWAVSFYNAPGGYTIGQVWKDPNKPDPTKALFPEGTVAVKLLFTQATGKQVPYLEGSPEWTANIYDLGNQPPPSPPKDLPRKPQTLRLVQIDVAVRDKDANKTTGWVFGTFTYDKDAPGQTAWDRIVPIGLMYGNDPTLTRQKIQIGKLLKESVICKSFKPPQHLGYAGRLNGPVDNPNSSCLSCHSTAQFPIDLNADILPPHVLATENGDKIVDYDSKIWMDWYRNVKAGTPFNKGISYLCQDTKSLDYSLQLSVGILRFYESKKEKPMCNTNIMDALHAVPDLSNFFNRDSNIAVPRQPSGPAQ